MHLMCIFWLFGVYHYFAFMGIKRETAKISNHWLDLSLSFERDGLREVRRR